MSNELAAPAGLPAQATGDLPPGYADLLGDIKAEISSTQLRVRRIVSTEQICHYWRIGRLILDRQEQEGWGTKVINRLSVDLRTAFPEQRGLSPRSLRYMQHLAKSWPEPIGQQAAAQLPRTARPPAPPRVGAPRGGARRRRPRSWRGRCRRGGVRPR
ncbi:DUF1016 N-terminal domain-containing protein [Kitasatospora sp. NPDC051853]|uniref:DUF1016 N-terminal domain-containing protein n=1 Tax=Kitasatospora sp. NPDC051853 TaxID=3364058 RepID=UPI0037B321BC